MVSSKPLILERAMMVMVTMTMMTTIQGTPMVERMMSSHVFLGMLGWSA